MTDAALVFSLNPRQMHGALIKVTGCNDTDERQNWAYTMKGQIMVSSIVVDIIHVAILKDVFFAANLVTSRFRVEN